jgi:hypothetical protein
MRRLIICAHQQIKEVVTHKACAPRRGRKCIQCFGSKIRRKERGLLEDLGVGGSMIFKEV